GKHREVRGRSSPSSPVPSSSAGASDSESRQHPAPVLDVARTARACDSHRMVDSRQALVRVRLPLPAAEAWSLVTDVRNHARWLPLARIEAPAEITVGDTFTAVTGPGAGHGWP